MGNEIGYFIFVNEIAVWQVLGYSFGFGVGSRDGNRFIRCATSIHCRPA